MNGSSIMKTLSFFKNILEVFSIPHPIINLMHSMIKLFNSFLCLIRLFFAILDKCLDYSFIFLSSQNLWSWLIIIRIDFFLKFFWYSLAWFSEVTNGWLVFYLRKSLGIFHFLHLIGLSNFLKNWVLRGGRVVIWWSARSSEKSQLCRK